MVSGMVAFGQGQINFGNRVTVAGIDAKVFQANGTTALDGAAYKAQLYVGATADSLVAVGSALDFRTGNAAGYITSTAITIPGVTGTVFAQMRAWETAKGATYEAAAATGAGFGFSNTIQVDLTLPPAAPADMVGLQSFALVIPEPSTVALVLLGLGALALRRRK